jgi:hypothetical protein
VQRAQRDVARRSTPYPVVAPEDGVGTEVCVIVACLVEAGAIVGRRRAETFDSWRRVV